MSSGRVKAIQRLSGEKLEAALATSSLSVSRSMSPVAASSR
jgi:hypothetical protein